MKCHYEVLEIPQSATEDDIKKAYRKLALKWHPDKNIDSADEAKIQFQLIQQAYEVLSNPSERRWYDKHRDDIVLASTEKNTNIINLFEYYSSSCYDGFGTDEKGFFAVYRKLFEDLAAENAQCSRAEESDNEIPGFGDENISYEGLSRFYSYWRAFNTKCSFSWLDVFDINKALNRQTVKAMEKENKRIRNKARKERNDQVRNLVEFIRRRDPRINIFGRVFELMTEEKKRKSQEFRKRQLLKRQKEVQEQQESEWSKFSNIQPDLENIEAAVTEEFGEKSSDEEVVESLYCVACTKIFKTHKAFSNHENSKKHRDNLITMKASMTASDLKFDSEKSETDDSDETNILPTETKLATNSEIPDDLLNTPTSCTNNDSDKETSDEELISDSDLNTKNSNKNKSDNSSTCKSATDGGYILDEPDDQNEEDDYDTPNDELFSDCEGEIIAKSKKQKKKKNKVKHLLILEDSDDENNEIGLPMGLSKKQLKKQRKEKLLKEKLFKNVKSESNTDNVNNKKKSEKSTSSSSEKNQGKVNEIDDSPQETVSPLPEKRKGKKAKELRKVQRQAAREARELFDLCRSVKKTQNIDLRFENDVFVCSVCLEQFPSKLKLYEHLRKTTHGKICLKKRAQEGVFNL